MSSPAAPFPPPDGRNVALAARAREEPVELEVRTLLDQLPAILYVSEVGVTGRWHFVSAGVEAVLGFSAAEWIADAGLWARQIHPEDRARVFEREDALVEPTVPDEYRMRHREGRIVWVRDEAALVTDTHGRMRWHGVISDITDRKLAEAELERRAEVIRYQAAHDPLTGLPNRVLFQDRLVQALGRPDAQVAVVLLDIDNFKLVNDSLGHSAGDELLMKIAPRLQTALRPGDTIARLGGDEFVVLLERVPDERAAARVAARIVSCFESPFELSAGEHFAKASLGIAIAGSEGSEPAGLIRDADAAMYQAKARGRARYEIFDRAMRARSVERLSVENDLRRALEREQLRVDYQPIVSLRDGSIASVEALLRWEHPTRGVVLPADFILVAEESGLIEPIGRWVLEVACTQAAAWHSLRPDSRPLGIAVNLSVLQFTQHALEAIVAQALAESGIEPSSLCLEITESVLHDPAPGPARRAVRAGRLRHRLLLARLPLRPTDRRAEGGPVLRQIARHRPALDRDHDGDRAHGPGALAGGDRRGHRGGPPAAGAARAALRARPGILLPRAASGPRGVGVAAGGGGRRGRWTRLRARAVAAVLSAVVRQGSSRSDVGLDM
jgi:diguanylate cyclase (GGDEF)-like protein/PAS domain S-box-containing protein